MACACGDEERRGITDPLIQPIAVEYLHDTGASGCGLAQPPCLLDDVVGPWQLTGNSGTYYSTTAVNAVTPTGRGETLTADYLSYHHASQTSTSGQVACWAVTGANRSREVRIYGKGADCSSYYFYFTASVTLPQPVVVEYERPATHTCAPYSWCAGPYRIKLDIRGSGWYQTDETRIYVENATGGRWGMSANSFTVDGTTLEFVFNSLYYTGAGSRILILYQPWGRNVWEDTVNTYLPFDAQAPQLVLTAVPTEVISGDSVTFHAVAAGSGVLEPLDWRWMPSDSSVAQDACPSGTNPCVTSVHETGRMELDARVDGQFRQADVEVDVVNACPDDLPFLGDSTVVEGLREMWYYSHPDSIVEMRRERMGVIVSDNGRYHIDWQPRLSDPCSVHDPLLPRDIPDSTVAWVHTHPASGEVITPGTCSRPDDPRNSVWRGGGRLRGSPSGYDIQYAESANAALGREIPGVILEELGLWVFDTSGRRELNTTCVEWRTGVPLWPPQMGGS